MKILVLDVGTSSMRGILYNCGGTKLLEEASPYCAKYLPGGQVQQDVAEWENAMWQILRSAAERAKANGWTIDAVSMTAQRSSVIAADEKMHPLQPAIMWQDKRTTEICSRLEQENEWVFSRCGSRINPVFAASKMTWIRENQPGIYERTHKFLVISDYLLYLLTGECKTDYTYGSRTLLMDLRNRRWDDQLLELFAVEREKLCELTEPGTIFGVLTKDAAERTGLFPGTPVISAGGDQQCGAIGQGVFSQGRTSITAGTGGYIITASDGVPSNLAADITCNCSSLPNQYILEAGMLTCCSAFDWFRRNFCKDWDIEKISAAVEEVPPGAEGLICLPLFSGRGNPDWNNAARGGFGNVSLNHEKRHFLRALLEGVCYEFANGLGVIRRYVKVADVALNGGLSNSRVFDQMLCDVLGIPVVKRGGADATALGALIVAAHALDPSCEPEQIFNEVHKKSVIARFEPDDKNEKIYREGLLRMNDWYQKIY